MAQKNALVTGSNRGIGFQICRELSERGYHVYATGRDADRLNQTIGMLRAENDNITARVLDVTDKDSLAKLVKEFRRENVELDVLVNNAAILLDKDKSILEISKEDFLQTLNTNTVAPLIVTRAFLPFMKRGSRIVMMSSDAGAYCQKISDWGPAYSLSKTGINAVTRHLAPLLADQGVLINCVNPGWTKTDMGGDGALRSVQEGAETPVWLATEVEVSGKFWKDKKEIDW